MWRWWCSQLWGLILLAHSLQHMKCSGAKDFLWTFSDFSGLKKKPGKHSRQSRIANEIVHLFPLQSFAVQGFLQLQAYLREW
jgi:hypothetical protein